jgi:hypothetical protein
MDFFFNNLLASSDAPIFSGAALIRTLGMGELRSRRRSNLLPISPLGNLSHPGRVGWHSLQGLLRRRGPKLATSTGHSVEYCTPIRGKKRPTTSLSDRIDR